MRRFWVYLEPFPSEMVKHRHVLRAILFSVVLLQRVHGFDKFDEKMGNELCKEYHRDLDGPYGYSLEGIKATTTTIAQELSSAEGKDLVGRFFETFEAVNEYQSTLTKDGNENCKSNYEKIEDRVRFYGFGDLEKCPSIHNKTAIKGLINKEQDLIDDIEQLKEEGELVSEAIANAYGLDWKGYVNDKFPVEDRRIVQIRKCTAYRALGIRVNGTWSLAVSIYQHPYNFNAGKWKRVWITEFVTKNGTELSQHKIHHPTCEKLPENETSTLVSYSTGTAVKERGVSLVKWDHYGRSIEHISEHSGIEVALEESARHRELLQDSSAASNIAILVLPGLLTLFPIGLFQDANIRTTIAFSIATDVISVLPIMIKGCEMIHYGRKKYFGNQIRFHGSPDPDKIAIVQFFPAKCEFDSRIVIFGIVLLCIGLILMFLGLSLEYLSLKKVEEKKSEDVGENENNDYGLLYYWNKKDE